MVDENEISVFYAQERLMHDIILGIQSLGKSIETVTVDDLAVLDEFHVGGREATLDLFNQLAINDSSCVLDVGCGLGGAARFAADMFGCQVIGIDLTSEYIAVGQKITNWVALDNKVTLQQGSALDLPMVAAEVDIAFMLHVGMNIADKAQLASEVYRILKPGGLFAIYDVMIMTNKGVELTYPFPWAEEAATSTLDSPQHYRHALEEVGFSIQSERTRSEFAIAQLENMLIRLAAVSGLTELGLHLLMGENGQQKMANLLREIKAGILAPVELIARK